VAEGGQSQEEKQEREGGQGGEREPEREAASGAKSQPEMSESPQKSSPPERISRPAKVTGTSLLDELRDEVASDVQAAAESLDELERSSAPPDDGKMIPRFLYEELLRERASLESSIYRARGAVGRAFWGLGEMEAALRSLQGGLRENPAPIAAAQLLDLLDKLLKEAERAEGSLRDAQKEMGG
jgi:hypothetical protein